MEGQPTGASQQEETQEPLGLLAGEGDLDISEASDLLEKAMNAGQDEGEPEGTPEPEEEPEDSEDDELEDSEGDETEAEPGADEEPKRYTVKIDGQEQEVTLEEALNGYARESDYRKKTMELAEQRRQLEARMQESEAQKSQLDIALNMAIEQGASELKKFENVDWDQLKQEDMISYLELKDEFQETQKKTYQAIQEQQRLKQEQSYQQQAAFTEARSKEMEQLISKVPDFKDPEKAKEISSKIGQFAISQGYAKEEIDGLLDHRSVIILDMARKYQELMKADPSKKKVVKKPKVLKPGGSPKATGNEDRIKSKRNRLLKTGSVEDAAALMMETI